MQDYVQVYARFCGRLLSCCVLCADFEVELVMGWSRGGGWEVVDLAVERAVKLVNGRSALGKDPQAG